MKRKIYRYIEKLLELCQKPLDVDIKKLNRKSNLEESEEAYKFFRGRK